MVKPDKPDKPNKLDKSNKANKPAKPIKSPKQKGPEISSPFGFKLISRVDEEFNWTVEDPVKVFQIGDKLGEGTFGVVHKATFSGKTIAIKFIEIDDADADAGELANEIKILKECAHENIVSYYGAFNTGANLWVCGR
jgi:serine/threonine protein kinase